MFEYLMPLLVMPTFEHTLLDQTYRAAVRAPDRVRPAARGALGHVRVRLQRDRRPAATTSTARSACRDWGSSAAWPTTWSSRRTRGAGADGRARGGLRQPAPPGHGRAARAATASTRPSTSPRRGCRAARRVVVRSLHGPPPGDELAVDGLPPARPSDAAPVPSDPQFRAHGAAAAGARPQGGAVVPARTARRRLTHAARRSACRQPSGSFTNPDTPAPEVHLLSNGRYHVHGDRRRRRLQPLARPGRHALAGGPHAAIAGAPSVTSATRRPAAFWSAAHQPTLKPARQYEAIFSQAQAEFRRRDDQMRDAHRDHRLARGRHRAAPVSITNRGRKRAHDRTDQLRRGRAGAAGRRRDAPGVQQAVRPDRDPAFDSKPFSARAVARAHGEHPPWMFHLVAVSRRRRPARCRTRPIARNSSAAAEPSPTPRRTRRACPAVGHRGIGARSDRPIRQLGRPRARRDGHDRLCHRRGGHPRGRAGPDREIPGPQDDGPRLRSRVDAQPGRAASARRRRGTTQQLYARLAGAVILRQPAPMRAAAGADRPQPTRPVRPVGLRQSPAIFPSCCCASPISQHRSWSGSSPRPMPTGGSKGLVVDLVILNEDQSGYRQNLQDQIMGLIAAGADANLVDRPGGIFVRRSEQISDEDKAAGAGRRSRRHHRHRRHARRTGRASQRAPRRPFPKLHARHARARPERASDLRSAPSADLIFVERPRRVHARRPRVRHHDHAADEPRRRRG